MSLEVNFLLSTEEIDLVENKTKGNKIYFLYLFKYFKLKKRFPNNTESIPDEICKIISRQLGIARYKQLAITKRTKARTVKEIRDFFKLQPSDSKILKSIQEGLVLDLLKQHSNTDSVKENIIKYFDSEDLEHLEDKKLTDLIKSSVVLFEKKLFDDLNNKLPESFIAFSNQWLEYQKNNDLPEDLSSLSDIKKNPGYIGINSIFEEIKKLHTINCFDIPDDLLPDLSDKVRDKFYQRASIKGIWEFSRQNKKTSYALLAIYLLSKKEVIIDNIIELLIQITHKIKVNSEKKVKKELLDQIIKNNNKEKMLLDVATTSLSNRSEIIEDKIFPVFGGEINLHNLIKEIKSRRNYDLHIYSVIRRSYSTHYRKAIHDILNILEFRSNNESYQPLIKAVNVVKQYYILKGINFPLKLTNENKL